jgi:hypothetical protein
MSEQTSRRFFGFRPLQLLIILLVVLTAFIHLQRGLGMSMGGFGGGPGGGGPPGGGQGGPGDGAGGSGRGAPPEGGEPRGGGGPPAGFALMRMLPIPLPVLFLLNGVGYLGLLIALYLPALARYQHIVRWLLVAFTAVTIVLYFLFAGFSLNPIGLIDKGIEMALIVALFIEGRQATRTAPEIAAA